MSRMSKPYVACQLLDHGPLTFGQFVTITGWRPGRCNRVLCDLVGAGVVAKPQRKGREPYRIVNEPMRRLLGLGARAVAFELDNSEAA